MKDQLTISISTINGSYHFQLGKYLRRNLIATLLLFIVAVVVMAFSIQYLWNAVDQTQQEKSQLNQHANELKDEILNLESDRQSLEQNLADRRYELEQISGRVNELENVLGIESEGEQPLDTRLDTAALNSAVRVAMLKVIPNGSPMEYRRISSSYGSRNHPVYGNKRRHLGIDLSGHTGTSVHSPADGVVELVRPSKKGYGNLMKIDHGYGFMTLYAHLKAFKVKTGDFVRKGDLIALSGNSGTSTGPHLHYEVRFLGRALNPKYFINWGPDNFDYLFNHERSIQWDSLVKVLEAQASTQLQLSLHKAVPLKEISN
ncbi:peptidoglycan DD-metalloendopeptidase family protein [Photobacterium sp. WH77]|uniref:Peptidoglycan DD-metalloendopeptidase family protein n=1 Tax=Photobacterium arenosum TaxID=2774143 RepID=A0ABR9BMR5_9GAMM|nr:MULTISPECIES: M23 family metallopeptidase [Photobacterium]MBD8513857.1 peptidoglycan DD-metalloendopeptidase family protein [Photobacterium arenosum]MBV7262501.1 peptidoglycan DD-metalloendopeptidase family protein [Photobacterium sp. WH24]MCG2836391.1 peptidoglycan DD-metalloendopeptidase family protein [Photobacterium sp. WH77]MCG2843982.1 peptidoglycan DD-metalloendopeptidase family protein [Photobacterium sp. WH80]MDO6583467.1 peptidoglycan DD-metalloendopeptidase family protein [Photob